MNDFKIEFMRDGGFCIDPREFLDGLEPFDYDSERFYLVGASFSPDLSIPLHCYDPFDSMASDKFSTDLTPFRQQRGGENAYNFSRFCGEFRVGNGAIRRRRFKSTQSRSTLQLWSAVNRIRIKYGNNDTRIERRAYKLRSYTKRQKELWKEEGEKIMARYWEAKAREQLENSDSSLASR
nr:hypothetical protein Iba_chr03aCG10860 [Ipomoea batatas]